MHPLLHFGAKAKKIALRTRCHLLLDYVLARCYADGQRGLAAVAGDLHVGQIGIAYGTFHSLVVDFIAQLLYALGRFAHNRFDLLDVTSVQLIAIVRTHQRGGIHKGGLLEACAMAFNHCRCEYGHNVWVGIEELATFLWL